MILQDLPTLKCSEQTSVPAAIVYSLPSSQRIPWIHYFPVDADGGQFLSLLLAFKNTKTSRHSEKKQTRPSTKQDFSGEALSKQNTEASLASFSCNSSRAMTEWSAIFAFGVWVSFLTRHITLLQENNDGILFKVRDFNFSVLYEVSRAFYSGVLEQAHS